MMIFKILKKDFLRKKIITIAVFIFIMLSALLMASGSNMLIKLFNSLDYLFESSSAPHFTQAHSGEIDQNLINEWSSENSYVKKQQTCEMINISGSKIYINSDHSEKDTIMDNGFVKQNSHFDYLLNLNNEKTKVNEGEIAVPIYYMQRKDLIIGDKLVIKDKNNEFRFTITNFVRDVQMNPSMLTSKRFVVNTVDYNKLKSLGEREYLISFQLHDRKDLQVFSNQYSQSDLPQKGPTIDYDLLRIANSLTDGLIAAVVILISLLLSVISLLCLRFIILLTLEEDYKEIGVMKAIGISSSDIKHIYLVKYFIMALTASLSGYLFSLIINNLFTKNIILYIGTAPLSIMENILPFVSAFIIAIIVIIFCMIILRRFKNISAVEAIRLGNTFGSYRSNQKLALYKNKNFDTNIFLGLRDVILSFKTYIILFLVFILATFIIIVPLNFLNTIQSSDFVSYMGVGKSDIIMDLRQSNQIRKRFSEVNTYVKNDPDVTKYASFVTSKYKVINQKGVAEDLYVESGDFTVFPIKYLNGGEPIASNEIALSYLSAKELGKEVEKKYRRCFKKRETIIYEEELDLPGGKKYWLTKLTPVISRGKVEKIVGTSLDITERKKQEKKIEHLSFHDHLTDLYNRRYFQNEIKRLNNSRKLPISIIVGDIDGLKYINDNYGHQLGDKYIKDAAKLFKNGVREEDIVARIGGDEFSVILPETDENTAAEICERILNEFSRYNKENELPKKLQTSIGFATKTNQKENLSVIFDKADKDMYKNKGRRED